MKYKYVRLFLLLITILLFLSSTFKMEGPSIIKQKTNIVVGLYPLGEIENALLQTLVKEIETFWRCSVVVLKGAEMPRKTYYKPRNRYRADKLLDYLLEVQPANINYIVGITHQDISCTNGNHYDWGVFGLGFLPGKSCVISTFRLNKNCKSKAHFQERFSKVVIHELGHNFGLPHCPRPFCIMRDAEGTIKAVDKEQKSLCDICKNKLKTTLN